MYIENIIIGSGPSGLQLAYNFKKNEIPYIIFEKADSCASFFFKYPHTKKLISLNKKYTGNKNKDFNLRHDWNSLLNDDDFLFTDFSDDLYPSSSDLYRYFNEFSKKYDLNIQFKKNVVKIIKIDEGYLLKINDNEEYSCKNLIIATGLSKQNYPNIDITINEKLSIEEKVKHYADYPNNYFIEKTNLVKYINKKVLIIGGGNSSYELANTLQNYCSNVVILGSNKPLSLVSHYVGDIRTIYLPFLDTFYLKSLNGIDVADKNFLSNFKILQNNDENSKNYKKYNLVNKVGISYYEESSKSLTYFDEIILCTGWSFDSNIFDFNIDLTINNKFPEINYKYESTNNKNLFFIGSLMHSKDYKKGSGGFIHGFRYLIKLFTQLNYGIKFEINEFVFNGTMECYKSLSEYMFERMNTSSSLYQLYGNLCDIFYYDKNKRAIIYIKDITLDCIKHLKLENIRYINALFLEYGDEETNITKLGSFNKYNPAFLHPKIYMYEKSEFFAPKLIDRITFEEDLIADFNNEKTFNKLTQTLKMCNLII